MKTLSFALFFCVISCLAAPPFERTGPPPPHMAPELRLATGPRGVAKRLVIAGGHEELGSIMLPSELSKSNLKEGLKTALWRPGHEDVAVAFNGKNKSFVVVFLRGEHGRYMAVDVSGVEGPNLGHLGGARRAHYRRVETVPMKWIDRPDNHNLVQVILRTRAWDWRGTRYATEEPLVITREGKPMWR